MRLLVIRHAIAEPRERFARTDEDDDLRPLTRKGRRRMRRAARGLRALVPALDVLATSPLVRARQTADIVARAYGGPAPQTVEALRPDRNEQRPDDGGAEGEDEGVAPTTDREGGETTIAVVGHDPHLPALLTWLVTGERQSWLALRKGGACLVRFERELRAGAGEIRWLAAPAVLRRIGRIGR
jgi:phosphohistidine phosphatase